LTQPQKAPEKAQDKFKFQLIYLIPILASLVFGLACAYLLAPQPTESFPSPAPIPEDTPGAQFGNAAYFVILIGISATLFYILIKRRSKRIIKALIVTAMTTAALLMSFIYLNALLGYVPNFDFLLVPLMIVITVLFDLAIFKLGSTARNIAVICVGGALGIFFGKFIPLWSGILILAFLAIYDVIAVYKGPVGKIAESAEGGGLDQLQGLSFSFKDIQMGLGDLVFYSMLTGVVFFNFLPSVLPTIMAVVGILAGSVITFFMLEKKGIFPGLPFPILLGLGLGLLSGFFFPLF
jgi:presenilin-like A22 family membrane protease